MSLPNVLIDEDKQKLDELSKIILGEVITDFVSLFHYACKKGNMDIVKLLIEHKNGYINDHNYSTGMKYATENGHLNVLKYLNVKRNHIFINTHFQNACVMGIKDIANYFIETRMNQPGPPTLTVPLYYACKHGHREIVDIFLQQDLTISDYDWGLSGACDCADIDLVLLFIDKGSIRHDKFRISYTCQNDTKINERKKILELFLDRKLDVNDFLWAACYHGNIELVKFLIDKKANNWMHAMEGLCSNEISKSEDIYIMAEMIIKHYSESLATGEKQLDWDKILGNACTYTKSEMINVAIFNGATDFNAALQRLYIFDDKNFHMKDRDCLKDKVCLQDEHCGINEKSKKRMYWISYMVLRGAKLTKDYFRYPEDDLEILYMLRFGIPGYEEKLKDIEGIKPLFDEINSNKNEVKKSLTDVIIPELINVINGYVI